MNNKYNNFFSDGEELQLLNELIELFHTKLPFDKDSATQTALNLGQQDVINYILSRIKEAEMD
ncbi:hypothetical protein DBL02_00940 [Acinetobacter oleivorans]|uniref:hypothetical protein n=1 Tax=Acinetobacter oleivorans TaxID=1148157 RepID=UPI000D31D7FE|nr:hypothetical protein [Acinetobacter oleivorans]PTV48126.1 hypothetical protein DBL02_00940 [Acinetobacter oleivorans]